MSGGAFALVDEADYERVSQHTWSTIYWDGRPKYASARVVSGGRSVPMHRFLTDAVAPSEVDHVNGDGLDNRRANLRVCTRSQNAANKRKKAGATSRFKGVSWSSARGKWVAQLRSNGSSFWLGKFDSEHDAALAYDEAARKHYGQFAQLNFCGAESA